MALVTLCLALASCSDDTVNREYGEGMGYLRLQLGKVDVDLSSTTRAEADSLPDKLIPATADFMIDIKQGNSSVDGYPKKYIELAEGIELKAGAYTVTAYCGENEPIQSTPYFSGSSTVEIYPGKSVETTINAVLANAMLVPAVSESLQKHYSAWTLTVKAGDVSMTLAEKDKSDGYLFAKAEQPVNAVFEGTNALGNPTSQEWTVISSATARTKYVIQCDPDLSIFSNIQLTATATHTYAEGVLTGTDVTLNIEDNGAPLELVDDWNIQLLYNNTAIRSYTAKPENGTLMKDVTNGWPYVPQGSELTASLHLKTGETVDIISAVLEEIPQPEFTATVSGSTSYSVYKNSGADAANAKDGSSIFDINATATIAPEISNNPNYSDILKVTYATDSGQSSGELSFGTASELNSLAWQKHALTATVSFDGVEKTSSPLECDVTGLPYAPSAMVESDWDLASWNCKYSNGTIQLGGVSGSGECTATSTMAFYIPDNIGVKVNTNVTVAAGIFNTINTTFTVRVNGNEIISQGSNRKEDNYSLSGTSTFSPGACEMKLNSSYTAAGPWSKVYTLHILYN